MHEIREDGSLWREEYDIEDHSDPNAEGLERFTGCMESGEQTVGAGNHNR